MYLFYLFILEEAWPKILTHVLYKLKLYLWVKQAKKIYTIL